MKRIGPAIVILALFCALTVTAQAEESSGVCGDLTWTLDGAGTLTISGEGEIGMESNIPKWGDPPWWNRTVRWFDSGKGFSKEARPPWYEQRESIRKVVIESGITSIQSYAFADCTALETVCISDTVEGIYGNVFLNCPRLQTFDVDEGNAAYFVKNGVLTDGWYAVCYPAAKPDAVFCIPDGWDAGIMEGAFDSAANLERLYIPNLSGDVSNIDFPAFTGCGALTEVYFGGGHPMERFEESILEDLQRQDVNFYYWATPMDCQDGNRDIQQNVVARGRCDYHYGKEGDYLVWTLYDDGTLNIRGDGRMEDYAIRTDIHYDSSGIRQDVSYYTYPWAEHAGEITALTVGEGVTTIGNMAFADLKNLSEVTLPLSLTHIAYGAFHGTGTKDVYFAGTAEQWTNVGKGQENIPLTTAAFHPEYHRSGVEAQIENGTLSYSVRLPRGVDEAQLAICWYDSETGRMTGITVTEAADGVLKDIDGSCRYKLFLLNDGWSPLSAAAEP